MTMSPHMIECRDLTKVYSIRRERDRCLGRRQPHHRPGRVRGHHGPVGLRQVDSHAYPRRARHAHERASTSSRARTSPSSPTTSWPTSGGLASASCSSRSTCCPGPRSSATSCFRSSTRAISRDEREERAEAALRKAGLEESHWTHLSNQLSGGQIQRVAIARALINDPALILADEPTGNLDTQTGDIILDTFDELNERGHTIVLITHEASVAERAQRGPSASRTDSS